MSTRLNKVMVEEIISSVIAATTFNQQRDALEKEARAHASAMLCRDAPPGLVDLSKTVPRDWLQWVDSVWMGGADWNPSAILSKAFETTMHYGGHHLKVEPAAPTTLHRRDELHEEDFADLTRRATELADAYTAVLRQLRAVLNSSRTVEAALKRMPELAPHVPKVSRPYPLATTSNLLAELMAHGFNTYAMEREEQTA